MRRCTNNTEVKKINRNRVFRYVNSCDGTTSMAEIASALKISTPTVLSIINELKEAGVVAEVGEYQSTGGRKGKAIASVKDMQYGIGLDITKNHVGIACVDLAENVLSYERVRKVFENQGEYFAELIGLIREFVCENHIPEDRIAGVGIAAPVIVDRDRKMITNSHALEIYDVPCDQWTDYIPWPCEILNDANAAMLAEWLKSERSESMAYLSLSNTVGGAVIIHPDYGSVADGKIYMGNNWRSSEFGHIVIHPGGKRCYCGKCGCADTYCSALRLAEVEEGHLERFFEHLQKGSKKHRVLWEQYLDDLAIVADNLRMVFDCEIVLGGYVGCQMEPYIGELRDRVAKLNIFPGDGSYVRACRYQGEATASGAAFYQIERYIDKI